jgi:hypothetical protein
MWDGGLMLSGEYRLPQMKKAESASGKIQK